MVCVVFQIDPASRVFKQLSTPHAYASLNIAKMTLTTVHLIMPYLVPVAWHYLSCVQLIEKPIGGTPIDASGGIVQGQLSKREEKKRWKEVKQRKKETNKDKGLVPRVEVSYSPEAILSRLKALWSFIEDTHGDIDLDGIELLDWPIVPLVRRFLS